MDSAKLYLRECLEQFASQDQGWRVVPLDGSWALFGGNSTGKGWTVRPNGAAGDREEVEAAEWLAGAAARELGTPLTILRLTAESLLYGAGDTPAAPPEQLRLLLQQLHCVEEVFRNLLSLAHPPNLSPQVLSLNEVVQEMLDLFTPAASSRQLRAVVILDTSEPAVRADPDHLRQVCFTLLSAALSAGSGERPLEVRTHRADGAGTFSIKHHIGDHTAVFPTLSSLDPRRPGGDLLRVWQVVRRHGGRFEMQVDPRWDRSFVVTLPLEDSHGLPA